MGEQRATVCGIVRKKLTRDFYLLPRRLPLPPPPQHDSLTLTRSGDDIIDRLANSRARISPPRKIAYDLQSRPTCAPPAARNSAATAWPVVIMARFANN